jgi:hypothetical protein
VNEPAAVGTGTAPEDVANLAFPLQDGETVLRVCRRHWLYLWPMVLLYLAFALVPVLGVALVLSAAGGFEGTGARIFWVVSALWLIFWCVRIFLVWYTYKHDLWVVTNQRLIDSRKSNPFNLRVSSADLVNVQDMTVVRAGILRTIFDYGDIVCQTAADNQDFLLRGIPDPRAVQALVDRERDRERQRLRQA